MNKNTEVTEWRWPNFTREELACQQKSSKGDCGCGGSLVIHEESLDKLQLFRELVNVPVILNSAYRCPRHNRNVGGSRGSMHKEGRAFDVRIASRLSRERIHVMALKAGFTGIGDYDTFVHIDTGRPRYWNKRSDKTKDSVRPQMSLL